MRDRNYVHRIAARRTNNACSRIGIGTCLLLATTSLSSIGGSRAFSEPPMTSSVAAARRGNHHHNHHHNRDVATTTASSSSSSERHLLRIVVSRRRSNADSSLRWLWGGESPPNAPNSDYDDGDLDAAASVAAFGEAMTTKTNPPADGDDRDARTNRANNDNVDDDDALEVTLSLENDESLKIGSDEEEAYEEEEDDGKPSRGRRRSRRRRRPRPKVWAAVKGMRNERRTRVVNRKLHNASRRFEKRHSTTTTTTMTLPTTAEGGAANSSGVPDDDDDGDEYDEEEDGHCFLLPGWRNNDSDNNNNNSGKDVDGESGGGTGGIESTIASCRDHLPFAHGEIEKMPYVHGGFFGAAPFMLTNPHWTSILRTLMPDVYVEISKPASKAPAPRLIHWAENNPVVAAYGTAYELEFNERMPILEWDVYLDPQLVRKLKKALREKDIATSLAKDADTAIEQQALSDYDDKIRRRTALLTEGMLVAHGNTRQIITEQTGLLKKLNFSSVRRTRRTLGGGMFARQWLAVYSEAMKLGVVDDRAGEEGGEEEGDDISGKVVASGNENGLEDPRDHGRLREDHGDIPEIDMDGQRQQQGAPSSSVPTAQAPNDRVDATSLRKATASACPDASIPASISELPAPVRLVLDLKSRHVSRRVWALVIDYLRDAGAEIEGIASFNLAEMRNTTRYCRDPVNEIFFLHSAGDLQRCCHSGQIRKGDRVFFNAGSLFWNHRNADVVRSVLRRGSKQPTRRLDGETGDGGYLLKPHAKTTDQKVSSSAVGGGPRDGSPLDNWGGSIDDDFARRLSDRDFSYGESQTFSSSDAESNSRNGSPFDFGGSTDGDFARRLSERDFAYGEPVARTSTIQDYKEHYQLSIGLYVQECAIDDATLGSIVKYVNANSHVFDLGLSWGGINGLTVKGIEQTRFSITDGLKNQRYVSVPWKKDLHPGSSKYLPALGFVKKVLFH